MSTPRRVDKENVIHIYNEVLLSYKEKWNYRICKKKWINLESIILTQSQEEKKACLDSFESWTVMYVHVHMCHDVACVCV